MPARIDTRFQEVQEQVLTRAGIMQDGRVRENVPEIKPVAIRMLQSGAVLTVNHEVALHRILDGLAELL